MHSRMQHHVNVYQHFKLQLGIQEPKHDCICLECAKTDKLEYLLEVPGCVHCSINFDIKGCKFFKDAEQKLT